MTKKRQKAKVKTVGSKIKPANNRQTTTNEQASATAKNQVPVFLYLQIFFGLVTIVIAIVGLFFKDTVLLYVPLVLGGLLICQSLNIFTTGMGKKGAGYAALVVGIIALIIFAVLVIINLNNDNTLPQEIK
ncbi:MAG: hypothetical protein FWF37_00635 [Chloroflexi bacterium]|nr:hypothetical protein [Chloroflexota bacterium]